MSIPFYVNPETVSREKAEFARRNVARGRPVVALEVDEGILMVTENRSTHLRKLAELYDRIAFAGVGRYTEFEALRIAGVRLADMKGYSYHREDVTARGVANAYAQTLDQVFRNEMKPYEVELMVVEVGESLGDPNEMYHVRYDGVPSDEHGIMVMGGESEQLRDRLAESYAEAMPLRDALHLAVTALSVEDHRLQASEIEVALLANTGVRRRFRRFDPTEVAELLA